MASKNEKKSNIVFYIVIIVLLVLIAAIFSYDSIEQWFSSDETEEIADNKEQSSDLQGIIDSAKEFANNEEYVKAISKLLEAKNIKADTEAEQNEISSLMKDWLAKLKEKDYLKYTELLKDPYLQQFKMNESGSIEVLITEAEKLKIDAEQILNEWTAKDSNIKTVERSPLETAENGIMLKVTTNEEALPKYNEARTLLENGLSKLTSVDELAPSPEQQEKVAMLKKEINEILVSIPVDGRVAQGDEISPDATEGITTIAKADVAPIDVTDASKEVTITEETAYNKGLITPAKRKYHKKRYHRKKKRHPRYRKTHRTRKPDATLPKDDCWEPFEDGGYSTIKIKADKRLIDKTIEDQSLFPADFIEDKEEDGIGNNLLVTMEGWDSDYPDLYKDDEEDDDFGRRPWKKKKGKRKDGLKIASGTDRDNIFFPKKDKGALDIKDGLMGREKEIPDWRDRKAEKNNLLADRDADDRIHRLADATGKTDTGEPFEGASIPFGGKPSNDISNPFMLNRNHVSIHGIDPHVNKNYPGLIPEDKKGNADRYYRLGRRELSRKNWDKASMLFEKAIELHPDHTKAYSYWGTSELNKRDIDEAIKKSEEAITRDKDEPNAHMNLGEAAFMKKRYDEAEREYLFVINRDRDNAYAYFKLGVINMLRYNNQTGISYFKQALTIKPGLDGEHIGYSYYNIALANFRLGKYDDAIAFVTEAIKILPDYEPAQTLHGEALYKKKELGNAKQVLTTGTNKYKNNFDMVFTLAKVYEEEKKATEAIKYYKKALNINPDSFEANYNLARVYLKIKNYDESLNYIERADEIKSSDYAANCMYGDLLLTKGDYDGAIEKFTKAVNINGMKPDAYVGLGKAYHKRAEETGSQSDYDKALEYLSDGDSKTLGNYEVYKQKGNIYFYKSEYQPAVESYEKAYDINDTEYDLIKNMAAAYIKLPDYRKALKYLEKASNMSKRQDKDIQLWLMATYYKLDRKKDCINTINHIIRKWPEEKKNETVKVYMRALSSNK